MDRITEKAIPNESSKASGTGLVLALESAQEGFSRAETDAARIIAEAKRAAQVKVDGARDVVETSLADVRGETAELHKDAGALVETIKTSSLPVQSEPESFPQYTRVDGVLLKIRRTRETREGVSVGEKGKRIPVSLTVTKDVVVEVMEGRKDIAANLPPEIESDWQLYIEDPEDPTRTAWVIKRGLVGSWQTAKLERDRLKQEKGGPDVFVDPNGKITRFEGNDDPLTITRRGLDFARNATLAPITSQQSTQTVPVKA
jgi:hypothetical protein